MIFFMDIVLFIRYSLILIILFLYVHFMHVFIGASQML